MKTRSILILVSAMTAFSIARAGDITGVITLKGTPPAEKPFTDLMNDATCGKLHTTTPMTRFYVVGANSGLADVVVELKGISGKSTGASSPPVVMDQKGCLYLPQIVVLQTGQKLQVKNSDPMMHNVHINPTATANNQANNSPTQMPGMPDITLTFSKPEAFMKFQCDVHGWMFAWATVVDSPYYALTDKDGKFTIKDVPPGKYTVVATHRKLSATATPGTYQGLEKEVDVTGGSATADFTFEIK
jgi:plastocyanin